MEFSFGSNTCKCNVFRWNHTDKVVISDIDGTITKSDVLGHVMPIFGKDWTQDGVAELFTKIEHNGYKFLYLSARAISHSSSTRDYLRKIQQGNETMPDGPILLNPTSTMKAFHREVIKRQSELFKIESLNAIKDLFPENPFYAGYGNRINVCYLPLNTFFNSLNINFNLKTIFLFHLNRMNGPMMPLVSQKVGFS